MIVHVCFISNGRNICLPLWRGSVACGSVVLAGVNRRLDLKVFVVTYVLYSSPKYRTLAIIIRGFVYLKPTLLFEGFQGPGFQGLAMIGGRNVGFTGPVQGSNFRQKDNVIRAKDSIFMVTDSPS